jgi:hypothetical protein
MATLTATRPAAYRPRPVLEWVAVHAVAVAL